MTRPNGGFQFCVLKADNPMDRKIWLSLVDESPSAEVFAHPGYLELFEGEFTQARCAVGRWGDVRVIYPFLMRRIDIHGGEPQPSRVLFDLTTPYGYGGAFAWGGSDLHKQAEQFWDQVDQWAVESNVVTEFLRRSLFEADLLPYDGLIQTRQWNIVRDLLPTEDEIWLDFDKKVRKNVRRAEASGVKIEIDSTGERLEDFMTIYRQTMDRRDAGDGYYFSRRFFETILDELSGRFVFVHALYEGQIISTELVLLSRHSVYSFLGGTNSDYFHLRPNDLLKHEIIKWARRSGYSRFVLGGGATELDGIYRYKKSFAPSGATPFETGTKTFDSNALERLVALRSIERPEWEPSPGYFPPYRS